MTNKTLAKPSKHNKQIQEYVSAYKRAEKSIFVFKSQKGWTVNSPINAIATLHFKTQSEATKAANEQADKLNYMVYIFQANGDLKK
jgi:hypothetical protein